MNPLNSGGNGVDEITMVHLDALEPTILPEKVDKRVYLALDFNQVNNTLLCNPDLYSYSDGDLDASGFLCEFSLVILSNFVSNVNDAD